MKIPRLFTAGFAILLALTGIAKAEERIFDTYNFAVTPPDGWTLKDDPTAKPGVLATFDKPDKTAEFSITAEKNDFVPPILNESFMREYNLESEETGRGALLSGTFVDAHGFKCYERKGAITNGDGTVSTFTQVISVDGIVYSLMATRNDGDASALQEIHNSIASFRFLKQPAVPAPEPEKSAAYKAGYFLGQNAVVILPVSAVMIILILGAFIKISSDRKSRRVRRSRR